MAVYATFKGNFNGKSNSATMSLPVTSGVTVTLGDFVYFASGRVTNASVAGARLVGQAQGTVTGNAGGSNKVLVVIDPDAKYLIQNDNLGTTFAVTHVGQYFDLIGATGAQLVDTSTVSATSGQLVCLEYNPPIDPVKTDTSYGIFKIVEHTFTLSA